MTEQQTKTYTELTLRRAETSAETELSRIDTGRTLAAQAIVSASNRLPRDNERWSTKRSAETKVRDLVSSPWGDEGVATEAVAARFAHYQLTPDEAGWLVEQAEVIRPAVRIAMRRSLGSFANIVTEGRFKSVHETGTSPAVDGARVDMGLYREFRRRFESVQFDQTGGEPSVAYGFLDYGGEASGDSVNMPMYGRVQFTFKSEVASRATFCEDDSLQKYGNSDKKEQFMGFDDAVIVQQVIEQAKQRGVATGLNYVESQVHGGLELDDVESVELTLDATDLQSYMEHIELLYATYPDIAITVNIDFSEPGRIPFDLITDHPYVIFHPVVMAAHTIFDRARLSNNQSVQATHQEKERRVERLRSVADDLWQKQTDGTPPANFMTPKMLYMGNGDRLG